MSEHTPEPWHYTKTGELVRAADGDWPAWNICEMNTLTSRYAANARRIVACVNALAGVPTGTLEKFNAGHPVDFAYADAVWGEKAAEIIECFLYEHCHDCCDPQKGFHTEECREARAHIDRRPK